MASETGEEIAQALDPLTLNTAAASRPPSVPSEIIQHILSFLSVDEALPTLLACQPVSRSFGEASKAAIVWRPLVKAKWKYGELKKPERELPMKEDQKVMEELFRSAVMGWTEIYRARTLLDSLAEQHIERLVHGVIHRLLSIDTFIALGPLVGDCLVDNERLDDSRDFGRLRWVQAALEASRRMEAVKVWRRVAVGEVTGAEALERGVFGLAEFSALLRPGRVEDAMEDIAATLEPVFPSVDDDPVERLYRIVDRILSYMSIEGIEDERVDDDDWDRQGRFNWESESFDLVSTPAPRLRRSPFEADGTITDFSPDAVLIEAYRNTHEGLFGRELLAALGAAKPTVAAVTHLAMFCAIGRRFAFRSRLVPHFTSDPRQYVVALDSAPSARVAVAAPTRVLFPAEEVDRVYGSCDLQPRLLLVRLARSLAGRADLPSARQQRVTNTTAGYAGRLLTAVLDSENLASQRRLHPVFGEQLLELFAEPSHLHEISILEHFIAPSLLPDQAQAAQRLIAEARERDAAPPVARRRPTDCPLTLKVGDFIKLLSTGELGLIVGWETCPGKAPKAIPRRRPERSAPAPRPLPAVLEYTYLVSRTVRDPAVTLSEAKVVKTVVYDYQSTLDFLRRIPLRYMQLFSEWRTSVLGELSLVPSAELEATYPDG